MASLMMRMGLVNISLLGIIGTLFPEYVTNVAWVMVYGSISSSF
jgi:hypothetical protein